MVNAERDYDMKYKQNNFRDELLKAVRRSFWQRRKKKTEILASTESTKGAASTHISKR